MYIIECIHTNGGQFLERIDEKNIQMDHSRVEESDVPPPRRRYYNYYCGWKVIHDPIIKRNKITQAFRVRNRNRTAATTKKNQGLQVLQQPPRYGDKEGVVGDVEKINDEASEAAEEENGINNNKRGRVLSLW